MIATELKHFLSAENIVLGLRAGDKPRLLAELARRAAEPTGLDASTIETALGNRERLGSTGLGGGFALPHARMPGLGKFFGSLTRLARPIDFDAIDGEPVDLVFLLLIPDAAQGGHVSALAAIARRMRDDAVRRRLRTAKDASAAYAILLES